MKTIILMMCLSTLAACSSSSSGSKAGAAPVAGQKTDYSVCDGTQSPSSIEGSWTSSGSDNGVDLTRVISISKNSLKFSMSCTKEGKTVSPSGTSASHYTADTLVVEDSINISEKIPLDDGTLLSCNLDLKPITLAYKFKGSCLVLTPQGEEETILVPVK